MTEELVLDAPTKTTVFDGFSDVEAPAKIQEHENKPLDKPIEKPIDKPADTPIDKPIEDGRNFLKERLGYEDWDSAKNDIEALKTKPPVTEIKYEPLGPAKIKEYYAIIDKKEKLEQLTTGDVTKENAPAIIKAAMTEKYKLPSDMVNHKFNKQFAMPPKPKQDSYTDTEEYEAATNDWKEKVADIEMDMLVEANLSRPDLEKIKSELKLPEIEKTTPLEKQPTPEDLVDAKKVMDLFIQNADAALNKFEGFNAEYKDKDVDIKSTYALSNDEKVLVAGKMKLLAEKNYNSNAIFAERWVNDDNTFNFDQIAKDIAVLETYDKSAQKFIGDAAAKAKVQFIKDKHNIDLGNQQQGDLQLEDKERQKKEEDALWA